MDGFWASEIGDQLRSLGFADMVSLWINPTTKREWGVYSASFKEWFEKVDEYSSHVEAHNSAPSEPPLSNPELNYVAKRNQESTENGGGSDLGIFELPAFSVNSASPVEEQKETPSVEIARTNCYDNGLTSRHSR